MIGLSRVPNFVPAVSGSRPASPVYFGRCKPLSPECLRASCWIESRQLRYYIYKRVPPRTLPCFIASYFSKQHKRKMTEQPIHASTQRIFLRFRTKEDAPSDSQIIQELYEFSGLDDTVCFVHWQTRESRDAYVVLDVHNGTDTLVSNVQDLPHEIYQLSWTSECNAMWVEVC